MADEENVESSTTIPSPEEQQPDVEIVAQDEAAEVVEKIDEPVKEGTGEGVATSIQDDPTPPSQEMEEVLSKELAETETMADQSTATSATVIDEQSTTATEIVVDEQSAAATATVIDEQSATATASVIDEQSATATASVIDEQSTKETTDIVSKTDRDELITSETVTEQAVSSSTVEPGTDRSEAPSERNESLAISITSDGIDHFDSFKEVSSGSELSSDKYPYFKTEKHDYSFAQMEEIQIVAEPYKRLLTPVFLDLMCKKNKDKTLNLILRGSSLINNLKRRLNDSDLLNIKEYLTENKRVVSLDLAYNNITSEGLKDHLIPLLKENRTLKELILSNNELCLQGVEALSEVSSEITLSILRLNGNKLGSKSGESLARLIDESSTLIALDISETDQNVSSLACIAAVLQSNYSPCSVNRYPFSRDPSRDLESEKKKPRICSPSQLALYVRNLVNQHTTEETSCLSLSKSEKSRINCPEAIDWTLPIKKIKVKNYESDSVPLLVASAAQETSDPNPSDLNQKCHCSQFEGTDSTSNFILKESRSSLKDARTPILEVLFLDRILGQYHYQPLTYHFARITSDMLKVNGSLKELHLQKNSLVDSDVKVLSDGLKENVSLRLLDLSANHIGCLGLSHLADVLPSIQLEALILNHNELSDHGARCLFFKLPETHLKMLDLAHNRISDNGMMDLLYVMRKQPKIIFLSIWGNPFTKITLKKIKAYLVQGWLLTDSLDIQLYEVDNVLHHAWNSSADPFKYYYFQRPTKSFTGPAPPPQSVGEPLDFMHYDKIYSRTMSQYVPKTYLYPPTDSNTCTT